MKMQQKLCELQHDKERLEKRLEEVEAALCATSEKQSVHERRLQDLEVENGKLRTDLDKLRASVVEGLDSDEAINELRAVLPDAIPMEQDAAVAKADNLPVIRKKESDYLGMYEYKKEHEQEILKALIYDLKPKMAVQMLPGLPAYIIFMMIRYTDYINNDEMVRSFIQGGIGMVKKVVVRKGLYDLEVKALWLANMLRILHNIKQYSGEEQFQKGSSPKQVQQCLRNFDLFEYHRVLSDVAIWIYQGMKKLIEEEVQPILVPAVLEHKGIGGISGDKPVHPRPKLGSVANDSLESPTHIDPKEALDVLLCKLTGFHTIFIKHGLDPEIISHIFKQIFYVICAGSLNNLLLCKDKCHRSRGMNIRYNVARLEQWARDQKLHDEQTTVIEVMAPIVQASKLLQTRMQDDNDAQSICKMCSSLKVSQIIKILDLYTPFDEFEERVTPSFIRKIQAKLQERAAQETEGTFVMDTKLTFPVSFPFNPSTIQLEELEIPESYNGLLNLLKKI